ncbi:hypothetical protein DIPPA_32646 [Diplonema papillatum]|nr:hypothetical protein DIPPA_32646 [Diplonema papillatum]
MLQPRPPPVQQAERPVNPRTQQEEEALLTHPGGCTAGNAIRKASGASAARGNEKGDGGNRTGDQEAATNARNQRTTSAEEEGAWHPEEGPIKRKKTKATTPDSGVHRRKKKVPRASSSQKRPGTTGTPMPSKVKNGHTCPPSYSPTQSLESQENRTPLAPQMLDLDDAMAGDDVIR